MTVKVTMANNSSDSVDFINATGTTLAQVKAADGGSSNGSLALHTTSAGTSSERVRVTSAGNVGIGTSSPQSKLHINGASSSPPTSGTTPTGVFEMTTDGAGYSLFGGGYNSGSFATWLQCQNKNDLSDFGPLALQPAGGNLLVGTTTTSLATPGIQFNASTTIPQVQVSVSATSNNYILYNSAASAYRFYVSSAGQINATSTSITAISDASLKQNIRDLETGLTEVMALQPRRFDWKEETQIGETNVAGFIAQELEQVLPELVYEYQYNETETKKSIKMGDILPTLVKAIQEQQAQISDQQALIQTLTSRIEALENK